MNTRLWLVTGGCFSALLLIGVGHQYLNTEQAPTPSPVVKQTVDTSPVGRGEPVVKPAPKAEVSLSKAEQFQKLLELAQTGPVTAELPEAMRRTGGKKAIEPLVSLMRSTDDYKTVGACVIALQDYQDPKLFHDILARLDELKLLDNAGKMPWFSKKLFQEYAKNETDKELVDKVVKTRPSLSGEVAKAPVEHETK